jgi:hypothetical protein
MSYSHSVLLSGNNQFDYSNAEIDRLPYKIRRNIESLIYFHSDFHHRLWNDADVELLIKKEFEPDVLEAYRALVPLAYKADLARYCILYQYGGLYADLSLLFFQSIIDANNRENLDVLIVFRDAFNSSAPWIVSNSLIYSKPKHSLFMRCIRKAVDNVRTGFYGSTPLDPTGPSMVGIQLALLHEYQSSMFRLGEVRREAQEIGGKWTLGYYLNGESLVALINKDENGLSSLGITCQQNYGKLWRNRAIYTTANFPLSYVAKDYIYQGWIKGKYILDDDGIKIHLEAGSLLLFGPYVSLPAGVYRVQFNIELSGCKHPFFGLTVTADVGQHRFLDVKLHSRHIEGLRFELFYEVPFAAPVEDAEFLLTSLGLNSPDSSFMFKSLQIFKL